MPRIMVLSDDDIIVLSEQVLPEQLDGGERTVSLLDHLAIALTTAEQARSRFHSTFYLDVPGD